MGKQASLLRGEGDSSVASACCGFQGSSLLLSLQLGSLCTLCNVVSTVALAVDQNQYRLLRVIARVSSHYLAQVFHVIVRKCSGRCVTKMGPGG